MTVRKPYVPSSEPLDERTLMEFILAVHNPNDTTQGPLNEERHQEDVESRGEV
ncbi:XRE family transcriptional regulator [Sesbania bispinosa]|nr:XRE family transcriptional regulator [Sesbania bispinosa]